MKSRLLTRLDSEIRGATSHGVADCLRCERAAYLARHGDPATAARELLEVRQRHDARPRLGIFAWVNLAEGLIGHCHHPLGEQVRDKVARAHALSAAADLAPLRALSAAWLAQLDFLRFDVPAMARHAAEALRVAEPGHHAARGRAVLVIAQSYDAGGRHDLARPWYSQAHWHATSEGDDAALSAMLWNMASLRVAAWRQSEACESARSAAAAHAEHGRHALASAESAALFDSLSGIDRPRDLQAILRAQVCTLAGDVEAALALYEASLEPALAHGMRPLEGVLRADRAWCRLAAGQFEAARADAAAACESLERPGSHADRAPGHSRLMQVFGALGEAGLASRQRALAAGRWAAHREDQRLLVQTLEQTLRELPRQRPRAEAQNSAMLSLRR